MPDNAIVYPLYKNSHTQLFDLQTGKVNEGHGRDKRVQGYAQVDAVVTRRLRFGVPECLRKRNTTTAPNDVSSHLNLAQPFDFPLDRG